MSKIKNIKFSGLVLAATTFVTCSGCDIEHDGKPVHIDDDVSNFVRMDTTPEGGYNITLNERAKAILSGTDITQSTPTTTVYEQITTGMSTYTTTSTIDTTKKEGTVTRATNITRSSVPEKYTTTAVLNTTTTQPTIVEPKNTILKPEFTSKEFEDQTSYEGYSVVQGGEYTIKTPHHTIKGEGEGLYSIILNYYGQYNDGIKEEIKKLNKLNEDFVIKNDKPTIQLPLIVFYEGNSIDEISFATRISKESIAKLNGIDNINQEFNRKTKLAVVALPENKKEFQDMYGQKSIVVGDVVVIADKVVNYGENGLLLYRDMRNKNMDGIINIVEYMKFNGKKATVTPFAYNVAKISSQGVQCANVSYLNSVGQSYEKGTIICKIADEINMYTKENNGYDATIYVSIFSERFNENYTKEVIGGKQLTR